jgi:NAD(P)-dependent dehydrogenase (short-subunit alcohol dehydrogenase family)
MGTDERPDGSASGRLSGEVAVVTGSTAFGIGKAIALEFGRQEARVVVHGRNRERGENVAKQILDAGGEATFVQADLNSEDACNDLIAQAVEAFGPVTVLVNNAVASDAASDAALGDLTTDAWEAMFRVNATAPFWLCRAAIPHMISAGHGSIVMVSSRQAERPSKGHAGYTASKGAMNALTRTIAVDYADRNIRCNTVSPGYVVNPGRDAEMTAERRARLESMHLTRLGEAQDIAWAVVYLASHESDYLTGINLQLDGGSSNARAASFG